MRLQLNVRHRACLPSNFPTTAKIWDALTGKELLTLNLGDGAVPYWVTFSPDGSRIAVANTAPPSDGWASIWDARTGELLLTLPRQNAFVNSVAFSPDGMHVITTSDDQTARIWDAANGEELFTYLLWSNDERHECGLQPAWHTLCDSRV
jgi:WD40 repeat protein